MDEKELESTIDFVKILRQQFKKEFCKDCAGPELPDPCPQDDSVVIGCTIGTILNTRKTLQEFFSNSKKSTSKIHKQALENLKAI